MLALGIIARFSSPCNPLGYTARFRDLALFYEIKFDIHILCSNLRLNKLILRRSFWVQNKALCNPMGYTTP